MKTILISGGLGHLSQNLIRLIDDDKHRFIIVDNAVESLQRTRFLKKIYIQADISDGNSLDIKLSSFLKKEKIEIEGIVNTPAWTDFKEFKDTDFDSMQKIVATKLIGYANVIKASLPYLKKYSSIINIGSVQAHSTRGGAAMYSAANGGVISLTKALAVELRNRKIRINVVTSGGFDSPIYKKTHLDWKQKIKKGQCLSTFSIARVIKFLLSDESKGINGTEIIVDGGISALRANSKDF